MSRDIATRAILDSIGRDDKKLQQICSELIQIDSTNPPGDCSQVLSYLRSEYQKIGAEFRTISADKKYLAKLGHKYPRNNFVAGLRAEKKTASTGLAIGTHMDVVPPGNMQDWKHPPFSGQVVGSKIWGRGAVDAKCSLAAQLFAMKALLECGTALNKTFLCIGTVDDEAPGNAIAAGMEYVAGRSLEKIYGGMPEFAINAEASGLGKIWGAFAGGLTLKLSFRGKTAHPPVGINALHSALDFWNALHKKRDRRLLPKSPRLFWLSGGSESDFGLTPEKAEMIFRIAIGDPRVSPAIALAEIERVASGDEWRFGIYDVRVLSSEIARDIGSRSELARVLKSCASKVGLNAKYGGGMVGAGDLQFFLEKQVPGVTYGAGSIERCHVPNEFVTIQELRAQAKIYALAAYKLCGGTG